MKTSETINIPKDALKFAGAGACAGAGVKAVIGGVGLAATGTAIAVPMVLTGTFAGLALYGAYRLGQQRRVDQQSEVAVERNP